VSVWSESVRITNPRWWIKCALSSLVSTGATLLQQRESIDEAKDERHHHHHHV
jgi:hypothetical protein